MLGAARQDSSCSTHRYSHAEYGSRNKRPEMARDVPALTQKRKKAVEGGPVDPELIPYDGHVAGRILHGQNRGLLKCRSRYMALTGWELTNSQARPLASGSGLTRTVNGSRPSGYPQTQTRTLILKLGPRPGPIPSRV
ncbi:hypothetical protein M9H77_27833 [Catharanthus roseus]|uniref:Uncharacterized protein n=1 Tax=Catharanthus roseus TaxID=4058 RepID=A0ACC0AFA2_CATRO|nr:hypothetical protein M9H77_27833 [Catharanthus roseus]